MINNMIDIENLTNAVESWDGLSCYILWRCYFSWELNQQVNYQKSFDYFKYWTDTLNDPRCMYWLWLFYYDFKDDEPEWIVEKDNATAYDLFSKAYPKIKQLAESWDMYSIFILWSYAYYWYWVQEIDHKKTLEYINKSADLWHAWACFDMWKFYLNWSMWLKKDVEKAKYYLYKASELWSSCAKNMIVKNNL